MYDGKDFKNMFMTSFLQELINNNFKISPVYTQGGWLEVDSVQNLRTYEENINKFPFLNS